MLLVTAQHDCNQMRQYHKEATDDRDQLAADIAKLQSQVI